MTDYRTFSPDDAMRFADEHSELFGDHSKLSCKEFGDGNLNLVFRVENDKGSSLIVKQALPYARCVGESWPLTIDRARIEAEVLLAHRKLCPQHTVEVLHYDAARAAILMEDLKQYRILRGELIAAKQFPHLATQLASYLANTLFYTSDFALTGPGKKQQVGQFLNPELCLITEDLFFTDPYCNHERNNIHAEIRAEAQQLWHDEPLQAEVAQLKADFLSKPQALLHGDVHSGSIFINDENCKVIDAEFGFYGPIGFDVGSLVANLLLNYLGHFGLTADSSRRQQHQDYLLQQIDTLWQQFASQFKQLMADECKEPALQNALYQQRFMQQVWADTLGYAGCELIRRTVGLAHVADLDSISNSMLRGQCEAKAIKLGRELILQRHSLANMAQLLTLLNYNTAEN
ncbi:MAG: S-methyl-5-thioribose kinase [Gammaproteobacteria bacterium]|nr:S-methyl-5-thioribose kinase [Gammaproteobacteria bacterium]MBU1553915.1 S-methyl-5-thioribose kinase [Gammaproteobacteria bacterium]MBU2070891.1 S-methyl-5-thioribose kinase [Gammaproteobacteria bacterium]MBU2185016.1 S-methyl-5-thioribose kinase [Gammaproteobacteria bacterium]MBU2204097.1 S-methyl-5-thioribose kinase [Gammaproteobacteria bacterium]